MTGFIIIKTDTISSVTEVHLYDETLDHIKEEHPEIPVGLPCVTGAIASAISDPTHVETSYSNSYVYVDGNTTNATGDPLRVPVKVVGETSARVRTAYFASSESSEKIIWRKDE